MSRRQANDVTLWANPKDEARLAIKATVSSVESDRLLAFQRHTDRALETIVVLANPSATTITERVLIANWSRRGSNHAAYER